MIERIVLFKLDGEWASPARRNEIASDTRTRLARCAGVLSLSVGVPADAASEKSWDLSIVLRFASLEDDARFQKDAEHRAYHESMKPKMQIVKTWCFEIPAS